MVVGPSLSKFGPNFLMALSRVVSFFGAWTLGWIGKIFCPAESLMGVGSRTSPLLARRVRCRSLRRKFLCLFFPASPLLLDCDGLRDCEPFFLLGEVLDCF